MPELLHHQDTFFGYLTVQRLERVASDDAAQSTAFDELAGRLWHRLPATIGEHDILLATQAFDTGLSARCPALDTEQRCSVHFDKKPAICRVVPFDALRPDNLQHRVLSDRAAEAQYLGSDCIAPGQRDGFAVVTRRLSVVNDDARQALAARRRDLASERRFWGNAVFQMLRAELFADASRLAQVPSNGFLSLSLAPVLMVLADASPRSRARCLSYLEAQARLATDMLLAASAAGQSERAEFRQLRAFAGTNARLHALLVAAPPPLTSLPSSERVALDRWLGLEVSP